MGHLGGSHTSVEHTAKDLLDFAEHHSVFRRFADKFDAIVRAVESSRARDPWTDVTTIGATTYKLRRQGYRHVFVYVNAAAAVTVDNGIGPVAVNLTGPGWTQVDWRNEAEISSSVAGGVNIIIELRDWL